MAVFGKRKDGRFYPKTNGGLSSDKIKFTTPISFGSGYEYKYKPLPKHLVTEYFSFDELSDEAKENALNSNRDINDTEFLFDGDWFIDYDVFSNYDKKYYDLDREQYLQFPDLQVKDEAKFAKLFGIPLSVLKKVSFDFYSPESIFTQKNISIRFFDVMGNYIDLEEPYNDSSELWSEEYYNLDKDDMPTEKEYKSLQEAKEKFDDYIHNIWSSFVKEYEYAYSDEAVRDSLIANEFRFDKEGNSV